MNKLHFILSVITLLSISPLRAQLRMDTIGNITIDKKLAISTTNEENISLNIYKQTYTNTAYYGVKTLVNYYSFLPSPKIFGVYAVSNSSNTTSISNSGYTVGVYGAGIKPATHIAPFCAGVVGIVKSNLYGGGYGVYGAVSSAVSNTAHGLPTSSSSGSYAGYFNGNVHVTGTMTATNVTTTSDERLKTNIQPIQIDNNPISQLKPVSYNLLDSAHNVYYEKDAPEIQQMHYGLIAQEVQQVIPNIVYEDADGYLSVNYIELIPLLINKIQELEKEIEALK